MDILVFLSIALSGDFAQISHICLIMALCPLLIHLRPCTLLTIWSFTLYLIYLGLCYFLYHLFRLRLFSLIFSIAAFILLTFLYLGLLILFKSDICSFTQFIHRVSHMSHLDLFTFHFI